MITESNITYITEENIAKLPARFVEQLCELAQYSEWGHPVVELGDGSEWLIIPNDEETILMAVAQSIEDTVEYLEPWFLSDLTDLPDVLFTSIVDARDGHYAVLRILERCNVSIIDVAENCISCDGAGHFLARYDGEEVETADGKYCLYRLN